MKKVLFASTALIATAGMAAAEVSFDGYARFGAYYDEANEGSETNITSRFRLQIDASAESDGGVSFGARVRIQQNETDAIAEAGNSGTGINGARFFVRAGGLEVGVGNIFGAIEFMPGMYPIDLGLTGLGYDYTAYAGGADAYSSGGAGSAGSNGVEVIYSMGDFSAHASYSEAVGEDDDRTALHVAYTFSGWTVALGVQDSPVATDTETAFSISGDLGIANVTLAWADNGTAGDRTVLAARFDVGAATNVEAYYADDELLDDSYGVDFNHDLGGGVTLRGGVANRFGDRTVADLGVRFNF